MSQKAVLIRIENNLIPEIFNSVPDYDEAVQICKDYDYDDYKTISDYLLIEYEWIDIGEGESGVDHFIDDEALLAIYDSDDYEKHIYETFGLNVESIETGSYEILIEDLMEDF